jgi:hypothetical protein
MILHTAFEWPKKGVHRYLQSLSQANLLLLSCFPRGQIAVPVYEHWPCNISLPLAGLNFPAAMLVASRVSHVMLLKLVISPAKRDGMAHVRDVP